MQAYNAGFAKVYNLRWGSFAQSIAPHLKQFYESQPISQHNRHMLDLCCGTGQLALQFLEASYQVTGLDLSEAMLAYAKENAAKFVESGQARFVQGDAKSFAFENKFGLVVSTFDALNHLEDETALAQCFRCVSSVLETGGVFIFDLNTRHGLHGWNYVTIDDGHEDLLLINRGIYDEAGNKAWARITGFIQEPDGLYRRFEETVFNTVFDLERVQAALLNIGWPNVYFARVHDLKTPVAEPENETRVFVVARK